MAVHERHLTAGFPALTLILSILLCTSAGTAAGRRISIEASQRRVPEWVRRVPEADGTYLYFVGRSTGARSLEDSESEAAFDAVRQIVTMTGVEASFTYERLRRTSDLLVTDKLDVSGESDVIGLKRLATYYQKHVSAEGDTVKTSYNTHLLVRYPIKELEAERARLEQESESRVKIAEKLFAESLRLEEAKAWEEAFLKTGEVLQLIESPTVHATNESLIRLSTLRTPVLEAARRLGLQLRRVAVEPVAVTDSQNKRSIPDSVLTDCLADALLNQGFQPEKSVNSLRAKVLPRVVATCREDGSSSLDHSFCLSRWTAAIRLVDPLDDSVLLSEIYSAKGFGPDPQRAGLDARRKLRAEIFTKFARAAGHKLDLSLQEGSKRSAPANQTAF
ncbi:MAG TPA: hypothetical protein VM123_19570 [archaeon]|nr:hypothetical protein [archaeon]